MVKRKKKTGMEHLENNLINWFPGHMNKAVKDIKSNIKAVDLVLEIRDARAPMASGNKENYDNNGEKPYLIVLNKTNLADPEAVKKWQTWFTEQNESFIFINALDKKSISGILVRSREILQAHRLKSNANIKEKEKLRLLILGLPNTGKSTIINKFAKRDASKAAPKPGQTKNKLWVKAAKDLEILDTPGVMPPQIKEQKHGMWLSAIHALPDHIVTPDYSAPYIIEYLLKTKSKDFKEHYKFDTLDLDVLAALDHIGKIRSCLRAGGGYNYDNIYTIILNDFRKGALGLICFELPPRY